MSDSGFNLDVDVREPGSSNAARRLRGAGMLPAVLYGGNRDPRPIAVSPRQVVEILQSDAGQNSILTLKVADGRKQTVLINDYQVDPISQRLLHADFIRISMDTAVQVQVPIETVGEARGVKVDRGIMDVIVRELAVECLPGDIPDSIKIDVSELEIGDAIHLQDVQVPEGVVLQGEPDTTILTVAPPTVEEVEEETEELDLIAEAEEPEVIGKGDDDEEADE